MRLESTQSSSRGHSATECEQRLRRRIDAFPHGTRPAVEKVAKLSPALEDLAESFPAMLFALASGFGTTEERKRTLEAIDRGMPLKEAARRLGLPFWMRRLPPVAFFAPIVAPPDDPELGRRLVGLAPSTRGDATCWLERVLVAHHTGYPELALWTAQQFRAGTPAAQSLTFLGVLAWAWFSLERNHPAAAFITTPWSPGIGAKRAIEEARLWQEKLALSVCLGNGIRDIWLREGAVDGLQFVALRTAQDFIAEAEAMDNCLDRYADRLMGRAARVFSIRRDGQSVANIEIVPHQREPGHPTIGQLRGAHNRRAPLAIWQAAYIWLGSQPLRLADKQLQLKLSKPTQIRRQLALRKPFLDVLPAYVRSAFMLQYTGKPKPAKPDATDGDTAQ